MNENCPPNNSYADRFPRIAVDIVIELLDNPNPGSIVLIERRHEPHGYALPGGFVDAGETLVAAAIREAYEETGLQITDVRPLGVYDDPKRDPRRHVISFAFKAKAIGLPKAADDAKDAFATNPRRLSAAVINTMVCDHRKIIADYLLS